MIDETTDLLTRLIASTPAETEAWIEASASGGAVKRRAYIELMKHIKDFKSGKVKKKWIVMPGLRRIGKTTLLAQVYTDPILQQDRKYYVSLDTVQTIGATVSDLLRVISESVGEKLTTSDKPLFLFLDEVQYLDDWGVALKTLYDRGKRVFIVCTGSSALSLQTNADIAARADISKLYPLCFTEYVMINQILNGRRPSQLSWPIDGLAYDLKSALFYSRSATQVYTRLAALEQKVDQYWSGIGGDTGGHIREYLSYGTLPFALTIPDKRIVSSRINQLLSEVLGRDFIMFGEFDKNTVAKLPHILFLLATSNNVSQTSISSITRLHYDTVGSVLEALAKTEIVTAIPPRSSSKGRVRKPWKYPFTSPALRAGLLRIGGVTDQELPEKALGLLLEDAIAFYLKRIFDRGLTDAAIEHDYQKGGADYILTMLSGARASRIAVEVGVTKDKADQVKKSLDLHGGKYGLVIAGDKLDISNKNNAVFVPLKYFLLV